jgi:hypothetical protein
MTRLRVTIVLATALVLFGCGSPVGELDPPKRGDEVRDPSPITVRSGQPPVARAPSDVRHAPAPPPDAVTRELIGVWETDADLTKTLPANAQLNADKLNSEAHLFGIQMKRRQTFFADGRFTMNLHGESTDFRYRVVAREGTQLTLQCSVVIDPQFLTAAEREAVKPFISEWLVLSEDIIANKTKGSSGEFWLVYRRAGKMGSPSVADLDAADSEQLKRQALAMPAIEWTCTETDAFRRLDEFQKWFLKNPALVPEVSPTVVKWLDSAGRDLDATVTNKPTGAQFRISGKKDSTGVWCCVKFVGNINWK